MSKDPFLPTYPAPLVQNISDDPWGAILLITAPFIAFVMMILLMATLGFCSFSGLFYAIRARAMIKKAMRSQKVKKRQKRRALRANRFTYVYEYYSVDSDGNRLDSIEMHPLEKKRGRVRVSTRKVHRGSSMPKTHRSTTKRRRTRRRSNSHANRSGHYDTSESLRSLFN